MIILEDGDTSEKFPCHNNFAVFERRKKPLHKRERLNFYLYKIFPSKNLPPIRMSLRPPDDIRAKIQAEYQKGVRGHGTKSLAKKFGVSTCTVYRIVNQ